MRFRSIFREASASALSQPVVTALTILITASMCLAVLLTTGRTIGAQQSIVSEIDSQGTRSIIVRAEPSAGLSLDSVARLGQVPEIEWYGAFTIASDAKNSLIPGSTPVAVREVVAEDLSPFGIEGDVDKSVAYGSAAALARLGMPAGVGSLDFIDGRPSEGVGGLISAPEFLRFLEPLLIVPVATTDEAVTVVVVIARSPESVGPVVGATRSLLVAEDSGGVHIETSEQLATLRTLVDAQLSDLSIGLLAAIAGVTAAVLASTYFAMTVLRRRDFGRRRALGASKLAIVVLLQVQMCLQGAVGAVVGCGAAFTAINVLQDPQPPAEFYGAVAALTISVGIASVALPAFFAARRDPLRELRVP